MAYDVSLCRLLKLVQPSFTSSSPCRLKKKAMSCALALATTLLSSELMNYSFSVFSVDFGQAFSGITPAGRSSSITGGTWRLSVLDGFKCFNTMSAFGPRCHPAICVTWNVFFPSRFESLMSILSHVKSKFPWYKVRWDYCSCFWIHCF